MILWTHQKTFCHTRKQGGHTTTHWTPPENKEDTPRHTGHTRKRSEHTKKHSCTPQKTRRTQRDTLYTPGNTLHTSQNKEDTPETRRPHHDTLGTPENKDEKPQFSGHTRKQVQRTVALWTHHKTSRTLSDTIDTP